jgi:hypothetical protein
MGARTKLYGQCVKPARIFINGVERPGGSRLRRALDRKDAPVWRQLRSRC